MRGYGQEGVVDQIRQAGGEIYAITSEPQRLASRAQDEWEFGFESVGDPHHEISDACRVRGFLELFVNDKTDLIRLDKIFSHPKGYFQPGVLALDATGRVLYRWRSRPTRKNMGGATERPTAGHVFENVSRALAVPASSAETAHAELDTRPKLDSRALPWPLFVLLLLANGWFIRPRPFPFLSGGPSVQQRARRALVRIPFFVAAWGVALALLPKWWVGVAFVAWAAWVTPGIRFLGSQFQNEAGKD